MDGRLSSKEILLILKQFGPGYSRDPDIGALQAKLSIMLGVALRLEEFRPNEQKDPS